MSRFVNKRGHKYSQTHRYMDTEEHGHTATWTDRNRDTEQGHTRIWTHSNMDTQEQGNNRETEQGHTGTWTHRNMDTLEQGHIAMFSFISTTGSTKTRHDVFACRPI